MANCNLLDSCFFFKDKLTGLPLTTEYLRDKYCKKDFNECARYRIAILYGKDKVPEYLCPNDMYEILNFNLFDPQGGLDMVLLVIYPDGTFGTVRTANLGELAKSGGIAAYKCLEGWVEVRRRRNIGYRGRERRINNAILFQ